MIRVGQDHWRAKLTDREVYLIRVLLGEARTMVADMKNAGAKRKARKTDPQRWQETKDATRWAEGWTEEAPVHAIVCALQAPPLRPAGPASVWGLA